MWLCNYPVYNHTISSTNWWFKPAAMTVLFLKWWVSICHFFYMYNWEFCMASFPFFPIYLLSYIWIFIFILWIIIHYSHCSDCPQFGHWELLKSPPLLFDTLPWFFFLNISFRHTRSFRNISYFLCPPFRSQLFLQRSPSSLYWCLGLTNQDLGT